MQRCIPFSIAYIPCSVAHLFFFEDLRYDVSVNRYRFAIIIEQDKDGYLVRCPELQGCYSQGGSYEEARENIRDAIILRREDALLSL